MLPREKLLLNEEKTAEWSRLQRALTTSDSMYASQKRSIAAATPESESELMLFILRFCSVVMIRPGSFLSNQRIHYSQMSDSKG
jgi:hypothetical protein